MFIREADKCYTCVCL